MHLEKIGPKIWTMLCGPIAPPEMSSYQIVFRKACHLPVEFVHKTYWALKQLNMDLEKAEKKELYSFINWKNSEEKPLKMHPSTKNEQQCGMRRHQTLNFQSGRSSALEQFQT